MRDGTRQDRETARMGAARRHSPETGYPEGGRPGTASALPGDQAPGGTGASGRAPAGSARLTHRASGAEGIGPSAPRTEATYRYEHLDHFGEPVPWPFLDELHRDRPSLAGTIALALTCLAGGVLLGWALFAVIRGAAG